VFVDGGAWRGDTIRKFLARQGPAFRRMHAFEPDPHNFRELTASLSTLAPDLGAKIAAYRCALGARPGPVRFQAHGSAGSRVGSEGSAEVECVTLDAQLRDETPTYLKLDVEGAEADALAGGQEVIRRARPIVAVSVYHRPADLWELPLYLHSLYAGYRFYLRTHDHDGTEVVCYALPPQRLPGREERLADV
jgi:FkbM family methyltransferase